MFAHVVKVSVLLSTLVLGTLAFAMEPLTAISPRDEEYNYYSSVIRMDQKLVADGYVGVNTEFDHFNVAGRVVALADGTRSNPYNLVLTVNGNLYYVDAILNTVDSFKIRRRWVNNPEPGVFLRIEGRRVNPEDGHSAVVTVWIKIATPEGRALPVLKVLEGNYDLGDTGALPSLIQNASSLTDDLDHPWPGPLQDFNGEGNPGPLLPPPPMNVTTPDEGVRY